MTTSQEKGAPLVRSAAQLWICQVCAQTIEPGTGYLEIVNLDPAAGPVGGYPRHATPSYSEWLRATGRHNGGLRALSNDEFMREGDAFEQEARAIGFKIVHADCDPTPDLSGYSLPSDHFQSVEDWLRTLHHLSAKSWMGLYDLQRLMELWPLFGGRARGIAQL